MSDPEAPKPPSNQNMRLAGLGMELAGAVVGGSLLGYWLDARSGTSPRWLIIGAAIGVVGGLYNLIRQALRAMNPSRGKRSGLGDDS